MRHLLAFILLLFTISLRSQYTITAAMNPTVGDVEQYYFLSAPIPTSVPSGTNMLWDYSGVIINPAKTGDLFSQYTLTAASAATYVPLSSCSNASNFPTATIGRKPFSAWSDSCSCYKTNNDTLQFLDFYNTTWFKYPFSLGSSSTNTYYIPGGGAVIYMGTITVTSDGTGTLMIPGNTFTNTLKVTLYHKHVVANMGHGSMEEKKINLFYSDASKFPLLTIARWYYQNWNLTDVKTIYYGRVNSAFAMNVGVKEEKNESNFSVYPNPVNGKEIQLQFANTTELTEIKLMNSLGQVLLNISQPNLIYENKISFQLPEDISPGIYFLKLKTPSFEGVKKLVVE